VDVIAKPTKISAITYGSAISTKAAVISYIVSGIISRIVTCVSPEAANDQLTPCHGVEFVI